MLSEHESKFNKAIYDFQNFFNVKNPIYLFEIYNNYFDMFIYGSSDETSTAINFYLSNMSMLEKFKFYFKDKAADLIEESFSHTILIPKHMRPTFNNRLEEKSHFDKYDFDVKRYMMNNKYLTKREFDVMQLAVRGYSMKEAAKLLMISPRTVETYLNQIKNKLQIKKKSEMSSLIEIFIFNLCSIKS